MNTCLKPAMGCIWMLCFFFCGCATDKVGMDLVEYVNQGILSISGLEIHALKRYAAVTGKNYTTEDRVYQALKDEVIPEYKRFEHLLGKIHPKTEEVGELHGVYLKGAAYLLEGFKMKMLALETNQKPLMRTANEKIEKGAPLEYSRQLMTEMAEENIEHFEKVVADIEATQDKLYDLGDQIDQM